MLPLFHYGTYNDLVMRASIPALFLVLVAAVQALRRGKWDAPTVLLAAALAIGALYPANLKRRHIGWAVRTSWTAGPRPMASVRSLFHLQLHDGLARRQEFVSQYLGATDTPFYRFLARRSTPADITTPDPHSSEHSEAPVGVIGGDGERRRVPGGALPEIGRPTPPR